MWRPARSRGWLVVLAALVAGSIAAGSLVAAQFGPSSQIVELEAAIDQDPLRRVAEIPAVGGSPARDVLLQLTSTGHVCLWDAPGGRPRERGGGCDPVDDPLGGRALSASLGYDGGPELDSIRDARIIGLAEPGVAAVRIDMSNGTAREVPLRGIAIADAEYRLFVYRIRPSDLRKGLGPVAVIAMDDAGRELGRQPTGFG